MINKGRIMRCATGGSLLALSFGAFAQTAAAADSQSNNGQGGETLAQAGPSTTTPAAEQPGTLQEIIVTAQKRSERINDVPVSITAATGGALASAGVTDTSQLTKIVPGFTFQLSQYGAPVFGLRGISFYDTSAISTPAVSVYVDQIPLPVSSLSRGASLDIERVEVLKGPQGTLFGENATGGAVNYIAAKPTDHLSTGVDALYGRFNQAEVGAFVSGPLGDTVTARLAARTEQRSDWQYSTSRKDSLGKRNFNEARLLLDWKPVSSVRFELNVNGWKDRSDTQAAQFRRFAPANPTPASPTNPTGGYPPAYAAFNAYVQNVGAAPDNARAADWDQGVDWRRNDRFYQFALRGEADLAEHLTVTSLSSYINYNGFTPVDVDGTSYAAQPVSQSDRLSFVNQELRAALERGPLNLLVGGYYQHAKLNEDLYSTIEATASLLAGAHNDQLHVINRQQVNTYAGFGGVDVRLGGGVKLQGSVRYTKQDRDYTGCAADGGSGGFALAFTRISAAASAPPHTIIAPGACFTLDQVTFKPAGLLNRSLNEDNLSWRAGISWEPDRRTLLYVNATKGYKAGGFPTLAAGFTSQLNPIVQESVQAYEAGFKLTLATGRVQLNAAAFHYDYTNKQIQGYVQNPPFVNLPTLISVPKSKIDGVEVTLAWQALPALRFSASGTYVDARVSQSFLTADPFATKININGERLPATPREQGNMDAEYRFNLDGRVQPYLGAAAAYQSSSFAAFGQNAEFRLPARTLIDLRAGVDGDNGRWRIEAFGRNVTNRYYWINVVKQIDTVTRLAGMPATYGVRVNYRY